MSNNFTQIIQYQARIKIEEKKFKITEITSQGNCSTKKTPLMTLYTLNMKKLLGRIMEESTDEDYVVFGWP